MSGRGWIETTVWRRYDIECGCGYAMQARWENGQAKGFAVCTKCGNSRELLADGPPTILRATPPAPRTPPAQPTPSPTREP